MSENDLINMESVDYSDMPTILKQFLDIKSVCPDSLLLFKNGEFYETYFDDAVILSKNNEIALSKRKYKVGTCFLSGFPVSMLDFNLKKLLDSNFVVSVADEIKNEDNIVISRKISRTYTKGTVFASQFLKSFENNFVLSIVSVNNLFGIAFSDISTGEFFACNLKDNQILNEIKKVMPNEIIVSKSFEKQHGEILKLLDGFNVNIILDDYFKSKENKEACFVASNSIINYVVDTQKEFAPKFGVIKKYDIKDYLDIDFKTMSALELFFNNHNFKEEDSLFYTLDRTKTPMGRRLFKNFLNYPLVSKNDIEERHKVVEYFFKNFDDCVKIRNILDKSFDIKRLWGKITSKTINFKDFLILKDTLSYVFEINEILKKINSPILKILDTDLKELSDLCSILNDALVDDENSAYMIKRHFDSTFDLYLDKIEKTNKDISRYERDEKENTKGIKIVQNKPIRLFFEVSNNMVDYMPSHFKMAQRLSTKSRYITKKLQELEKELIINTYKIQETEKEILKKLKLRVFDVVSVIDNYSKVLALVDVFLSFYCISLEFDFRKPTFTDDLNFEIKDAFHPVVYKINEGNYIKNSLKMDEKSHFAVLTGPNMAGKSTYLKQNAINIILAQMGLYVPCAYYKSQIFNQIFFVSNSSDELTKGHSTFMVEMNRVKNVLDKSDDNTFILFDELASGTSTIDGYALSYAISKYLIEKTKTKVLLATHFHKLSSLKEKFTDKVQNLMIGEKFDIENNVFDRYVKEGFLSNSYGILVASTCGIYDEILNDAKSIIE